MKKITRRDFLKTVGSGAGVLALTKLPIPSVWAEVDRDSVHFAAVGALPASHWPAYASLVVRGHASLQGSIAGTLTAMVVPGSPPASGDSPLPGLTTIARVEKVGKGRIIEIQGRIEETGVLVEFPGSNKFDVRIDKESRTVTVDLRGTSHTLNLVDYRTS